MILLLALIAALISNAGFSIGADALEKKREDKASIAGYDLEIVCSGRNCELLFIGEKRSGKLPLIPKGPCRFIRYRGSLQSYPIKEAGVLAVLIVVGTPAGRDENSPLTLREDLYCGTEVQGVLIRKEGVFLTRRVASGSITCSDLGLDGKEFRMFGGQTDLIEPSEHEAK